MVSPYYSEELIYSVTSAFAGEAYQDRDIDFVAKSYNIVLLTALTILHLKSQRPLSLDRIRSSITHNCSKHLANEFGLFFRRFLTVSQNTVCSAQSQVVIPEEIITFETSSSL